MTFFLVMTEAKTPIQRCFTRNVVRTIFMLSPGYASLPEPLQFVYTMVTLLLEGRFDEVIPALKRTIDPYTYYPLRSELPAVWWYNSKALQGFKEHSTTRVELDEVLGLELSKLARLLKLRPRVNDNQQMVNVLLFR